jgi:phosphatidylserine decarboxylase
MLIGIAVSAMGILMDTRTLYLVGSLFILLSVFFMIFFRDPVRTIGMGVVSPADGKVVDVNRGLNRVSIFMGVLNVHVNRAPLAGVVTGMKHFPGSHVPAFNKESERNERVETRMSTEFGEVRIIQIAGIVARRIVPYVRPRIRLRKGQRIGLIRLGSRVDIYLPKKVRITTEIGHKVYAGVSRIGEGKDEVD